MMELLPMLQKIAESIGILFLIAIGAYLRQGVYSYHYTSIWETFADIWEWLHSIRTRHSESKGNKRVK